MRLAAARAVATAAALLLLAPAAAAQVAGGSDAAVRQLLTRLWQGDLEAAAGSFAPGQLASATPELLDQAHRELQLGGPLRIELLGHTVHGPGPLEGTESLLHHVRGGERALLVFTQTLVDGGEVRVLGVQWESTPLDLRQRYPFVWTGVSPLHYLVLAASVTVPLLILYALGLCVLRRPPLWWLWVPFILVGVGQVGVVWLPGPLGDEHVRFALRAVQLLGVAFVKKPLYTPWVLTVSFPLGAVLFLVRYLRGGPWTLGHGGGEAGDP